MAMSFKINILSFTLFLYFLISLYYVQSHSPQLFFKGSKEAFTIQLIHRDSVKSPLFDNTTTHLQRIRNSVLRSKERIKYLSHKIASTINDDIELHLRNGRSEYIIQYSLGAPMFTTYGHMDTGSGFAWLQCIPSTSSYDQGHLEFLNTDDIFRDLSPVHCYSRKCTQVVKESVHKQYKDEESCQCKYQIRYGDGSVSDGHVFNALLTLQTISGVYVRFPSFIFGCSRDVHGPFHSGTSGIVGFGRDPGSLVSQIYDRIGGLFGYCLVMFGGPDMYSELKFGQNAVILGPDVIHTPIMSREPNEFYYITLEGISVGNKRITFTTDMSGGNAFPDCGATLSHLPMDLYSEFEAEVEAQLDLLYTHTPDPDPTSDDLCYLQNNIEEMGGPTIIFHLRGGDLILSARNAYYEAGNGVVCLAFNGWDDDRIVIGVLAQTNFMITYDLPRSEMSFKKMNCAARN